MASTIYALADEVGAVRYIGKTVKKLNERLSHHLCLARKGDDSYRSRWIRSLNRPPTAHALLVVMDHEGSMAERAFIAEFRKAGARLVNLTDGGEGNLGWKPSAETRARISAAHRGKKVPQEAIDKMVRANTGRKQPDAHREKVAAIMRTPEMRARMSASLKAARAKKFWSSRKLGA